jgi:integrase
VGYYERPNGTWRVVAYWHGQVVWSTTRPNRTEAKAAWVQAMADLRAGDGRHPSDRYAQARAAAELTVEAWLREWHPRRRLGPATRRAQWSMIENHVIPHLGGVPLAGLTQPQVQQWVWAVSDALMPRTVRNVLGILSTAVKDAIVDPSVPISSSPVVRVRTDKPDPSGREALTPRQVALLAAYARPGYRTVVLSLAFTGLRAKELRERSRHDLTLRKTVEVKGKPAPRTAARRKRKAPATKSPAGARSVLLCDSFASELSAYLGGRGGEALWVSDRGLRLSRNTLQRAVSRACEAARAAGHDVPEGVTCHWFRHTHRTWLAEALVPPVAVDAQMGHATRGMAGVYEHVTEPMRRMVRDALEVRWAEVAGVLSELAAATG